MIALASMISVLAYGFVLGGWFKPKSTLDEHLAELQDHCHVEMPEGIMPSNGFPRAVLVPGCLGSREHHQEWGEAICAAGWATVTVDSFAPRRVHGDMRLSRICHGGRPWGFERAADVIAAVTFASERTELDADRVTLLGWAHGGWSVMDALSSGDVSRPTNLIETPPDWSDGVLASLLFYPYCGFGSRTERFGWAWDIPTMLFMRSDDRTVLPGVCVSAAERLQRDRVRIELSLLGSVTHWFDNPGDLDSSDHAFDQQLTRRVRSEVIEKLGNLAQDPCEAETTPIIQCKG